MSRRRDSRETSDAKCTGHFGLVKHSETGRAELPKITVYTIFANFSSAGRPRKARAVSLNKQGLGVERLLTQIPLATPRRVFALFGSLCKAASFPTGNWKKNVAPASCSRAARAAQAAALSLARSCYNCNLLFHHPRAHFPFLFPSSLIPERAIGSSTSSSSSLERSYRCPGNVPSHKPNKFVGRPERDTRPEITPIREEGRMMNYLVD